MEDYAEEISSVAVRQEIALANFMKTVIAFTLTVSPLVEIKQSHHPVPFAMVIPAPVTILLASLCPLL